MRQGVIPMGTVKHEKTVARATWAYVGDSTSVSGMFDLGQDSRRRTNAARANTGLLQNLRVAEHTRV